MLELQIRGAKVNNKRISLNPFINMLSKHNQNLISSWAIFTQEEIEKLRDFTELKEELHKILDTFTFDAGRFGYIIPLEDKTELEQKIDSAVKNLCLL